MTDLNGRTNGQSQARARRLHRRPRERVGVVEERGVAAPLALELGARQPAQAERGIGDPDVALASRRRARPSGCPPSARWPAAASAGRLRVDALTGRAARPSSVAARQSARRLVPSVRREAELADAGQADGAPVVPAHHGQRRGAAVHLVDLAHVREAPDARRALDEAPLRRREGRRRASRRPRPPPRPWSLRPGAGRPSPATRSSAGSVSSAKSSGTRATVRVVVLRDALLELGAELRVAGRADG